MGVDGLGFCCGNGWMFVGILDVCEVGMFNRSSLVVTLLSPVIGST